MAWVEEEKPVSNFTVVSPPASTFTLDSPDASEFAEDRLIAYLLLENGNYLLDESEEKIRLEVSRVSSWTLETAHQASWA